MNMLKLLQSLSSKIASKSKALLAKCHRRRHRKASLRLSDSYGNVLSARIQLHDFVIVDEEVVLWEDVVEAVAVLFRESLVADVWMMNLEALFEGASQFSAVWDPFHLERLFEETEEPLYLDRLYEVCPTITIEADNVKASVPMQPNKVPTEVPQEAAIKVVAIEKAPQKAKTVPAPWWEVRMKPISEEQPATAAAGTKQTVPTRPRTKMMLVSIQDYDEEAVNAFFGLKQ